MNARLPNAGLLRCRLVIGSTLLISCGATGAAALKFDFGSGKGRPVYMQVTRQPDALEKVEIPLSPLKHTTEMPAGN